MSKPVAIPLDPEFGSEKMTISEVAGSSVTFKVFHAEGGYSEVTPLEPGPINLWTRGPGYLGITAHVRAAQNGTAIVEFIPVR